MTIQQIHSLQTAIEALESNTLLILDIDNTLVECATSYGSFQWAAYHIRKAVAQGESLQKALDEHVPKWEQLQFLVEMQSIESKAPLWLKELHDQGQPILGLTGRSSSLKEVTLEKLQKQSFYFSEFNFPLEDLLAELSGVEYHQGVIFVGHKNCKGRVLKMFLDSIKHDYESIVFVDDQYSYLDKVQQATLESGIEFKGFHFLGAKDRDFSYEKALEEEKLFFKSR